MKLFGGKKGGAHSKDTVHTVASELETEAMEAEQQEMEDAVEAAVQPEIPMIVDDLMIEETSEQDAEQEEQDNQEEGIVNSIAETLGLSVEEIHRESEEAAAVQSSADTSDVRGEDVKLTRKEKKAAKKAEKERRNWYARCLNLLIWHE